MKTMLRAVLQCVIVFLFAHVLHARTGEYVILTKSNFQYTSTTWSYTLTATAYTSGGTPITPQGNWQYYWEDYYSGMFTITYGTNSITYQQNIGVEMPYVRVYLNGSFYDVSNDLTGLGDITLIFPRKVGHEVKSVIVRSQPASDIRAPSVSDDG
ncbi:MAG: hypothetical protein L0Y80_11330, partial [Ignavibacteriae bacterium]|nr:hypothetical protein [Ignavibacteriota bacterium]